MFRIHDHAISADELTKRVRDLVAEREAQDAGATGDAARSIDTDNAQRWAAAHRAITTAELHAVVGERLPAMNTVRGWKRRLVLPIAKLILRAAQLVTRDQTSFNLESVKAWRALAEALSHDLRTLEHRLACAVEEHGRALAALRDDVRAAIAAESRTREEATGAATHRAQGLEETLWRWRDEHITRFESDERRMAEDVARLRTELLIHERQLRMASERAAEPSGVPAAPSGGDLEPLLAGFYARFEDCFRGSREEIRTRVLPYLDVVKAAGAGTAERPVLDLGCGRGEWLEVLSQHGLAAQGLDASLAMVTESRAQGLDVVEGDALAYLRSLPDASRRAVTAFHLIEHLPFATVIALVDEIVRVLAPGGVMILESPNPTNLLVGASSFYIDPTHRRPLHPETVRFLADARGLVRVEVRALHPMTASMLPEDDQGIARRLNEHLYGPQDFAVVGYRA